MKLSRTIRRGEEGVIIVLVAVFMLFIVGAMAALSIDVVTLYTARSQAQVAADGAALAAARLIANSGATSDSLPPHAALAALEGSGGPAETMALQIAKANIVSGQNLTAGEVKVTFGGTYTNPTVTVDVLKTNLPTFFSRIWGNTSLAVHAFATAEAYNPSGAAAISGVGGNPPVPVAPICVKPWLLPNIDPTNSPNPIFVTTSGAISNPALLGYSTVLSGNNQQLHKIRTTCIPPPAPVAWQFYPGSQNSFPPTLGATELCRRFQRSTGKYCGLCPSPDRLR